MQTQSMHGTNLSLDRHLGLVIFPAVTLFLVIATLFGVGMNGPLILSLLVSGVVVLGLPHGSLDPHVARQLFSEDRRFTTARFLGAYTLLAILCVVGWLVAPNIGLALFLVISALHFGSDWSQRGALWGRVAYGTCVVTLPTLRHAETVRQIYVALGATAADGLVHTSRLIAWFAIAAAIFSLRGQLPRRWRDGLELGIILIGGLALQPLVFFICYFCLLHSPRHLVATSREVGLRGLRAVATAVVPPVAATLIMAAILWRLTPSNSLSSHVLQIVFVGLAALTVPHMLLTTLKERAQGSTQSMQMAR